MKKSTQTFKDLDFVFSRAELAALEKVLPEGDALDMLRYDRRADTLLKPRPEEADYDVETIMALKRRAQRIIDSE